jgi:L-malate glycosyltransferase
MKILFSAEENLGGGAISTYNLAVASISFAKVGFFGIRFYFNENIELEYFDSKTDNPLRLRYLSNYWKAIKKFNPDVVHSAGMYTGMIAIMLRIISKRNYKIVMSLRHTYTKFRLGFISEKLIKHLNKVDIVHFLTDYQRTLYSNYGLNSQRYRIIPNLIIPKAYLKTDIDSLRRKLLIDTSSEWLIVIVGRLVESKQIDVFIKAVKLINDSGHNVGGVIVGDGDKNYIRKLKNLTEETQLVDKLSFVGFTPEPESYIKACDFCMFPTAGEALPRFIIESFSQKRTLVLSNHPSISNLITNNDDSIVVSSHKPEKYAEKCIQLIKNPALLKKLERGAYVRYRKFYDIDCIIGEYKNMYSELISN